MGGEGAAHAGDAHVLAEVGDGLHVELVEGDEAVEAFGAGQICNRVGDLFEGEALGHGVEVFEDGLRPVGVAELVDGEQDDTAAEGGALLEEGLALLVGADAEDPRLFGGIHRSLVFYHSVEAMA